ncbi:MAG: hypothetical protein ACRD0G_03590 [Acidimicrobiales bacterium]
MFRSLAIKGASALVVLAVPVGAASATIVDDTEPDGSAPASTIPGETSADEPDDTGGGPPPGDIDFQVDMILGLVPPDEMEGYWQEQNEQQQLQIQECMNEAGFEYNPETDGMMFEDPLGELSPVEYAEQWGFGVYTMMDPDSSPFADQEWVWPNEDIVNELSPSEQNAWFEVNNRCSNEAYTQDDPWRNPMVQQALEDFYTQVETDPRMREANEAWRDCMEAAGHPYPSIEDMYDEWYGDWEDQEEFYEAEAWEPDSAMHAEWQALVDLEIEVAVANAECSDGLDEIRQEVVADLRPEFVEVWQTIDWSLPPVTYPGEGEFGPGGPFEEGGVETLPVDSAAEAPDDTEGAPVGLDLSDPDETTVPATTEP